MSSHPDSSLETSRTRAVLGRNEPRWDAPVAAHRVTSIDRYKYCVHFLFYHPRGQEVAVPLGSEKAGSVYQTLYRIVLIIQILLQRMVSMAGHTD